MLRHVLRVGHVGHERVAVVVVARVLLIEPRRVRAFVLGAELSCVPVGDHDLAVGIEGRNFDEDDVVENALGFVVVARQEIVDQLDRHLAAADLGGVHAHRLHDDRLALIDECLGLGLGETARIADARVDLAVALELRHVGGRRDEDLEERVAFRGRSHVDDLHAAAALLFEDAE